MNAQHRPSSALPQHAPEASTTTASQVPSSVSSSPYPVHVGRTTFPMKPAQRAWPTPGPRVAHADDPSFVLLDGPPYANGALHLGHVLNKHLKDALVRAAQAQGHAVRWQPGWDCHGLPVELNVERQGVPRTPVGPFLTAARTYAAGQVEQQRASFAEQGLTADWNRPYRTMDPAQEGATLAVFADLVERGHVVLRHTPTWWCPACGSTLASAEHEEQERTVRSCVVAFELLDASSGSPEALLAWTTTAWTVPYHEGLVVNPDARYVAVERSEHPDAGRAWVAEDAMDALSRTVTDLRRAPEVPARWGRDLVGRRYRAPMDDPARVRTVVADASVQPGGGTGVLHAVPAFAHEDAVLGQRFGWPMTTVLGPDGRFGEQAWAAHRGQDLGTAQTRTMDALATGSVTGPWFAERPWTQEHPHCWRHKTPLVVRPSRQVYLHLTGAVRARALGMLDQVRFVPESGRARLLDAVTQRPDWCLSRQRSWGVPVALFVHRDTGALHPCTVKVLRRVAARVATEGVEAWWRSTDAEWFDGLDDPERPAQTVEHEDYERVSDVLDVWFDSGCVHRTTAAAGRVPDVVLEGHDQHRGWFQSSLWVAAALGEALPYRTVVTHGFVVQADGRKLSKSEGGDQTVHATGTGPTGKPAPKPKATPVPSWSELPSDVVRVWALQAACHLDKVWGAQDVRLAQDTYAKLRNSLRFGLANLPSERLLAPASTGPTADRPFPGYDARRWWPLDRWAVTQALALRDEALAAFAAARFEQGVQALHRLANEVLSKGLYTTLKDRLYCAAEGSEERTCAVEALHTAWQALADGLWVLTPNLMAELEAHLGAPLVAPSLVPGSLNHDAQEAEWWARTLAVREALQGSWAPFSDAQGGGLQRARAQVEVPLGVEQAWPWPAEALLDAWGVSGMTVSHRPLPELEEPAGDGDPVGRPLSVVLNGWRARVSVHRMDGDVCPRCRWVSATPLREGVCERCHTRHNG